MPSDLIDELEIGTYCNHGGFVKGVAHLTETWLLEGLITQEERWTNCNTCFVAAPWKMAERGLIDASTI